MARKERTPQELHERAYDSFDFGDDEFEDDLNDPFLAELDQYVKGVLNAPDPTAVSPPKK
jgi:hypothetical protein